VTTVEPRLAPLTFVVRVAGDPGALRGTVERVRTGEKQRFQGVEELGAIVARMAKAASRTAPSRDSGPPTAPDVAESRTDPAPGRAPPSATPKTWQGSQHD
jgi:hypothetical protein